MSERLCGCGTGLCAEHQQSFLDILADIPAQLTAMNASITKQSVAAGQSGKPVNDDDRPAPINFGAAEAQRDLMLQLAQTCRRIRHCLPEGTLPSHKGIPQWMAGLMPRIVQHPESVDWYQRIRGAYEKAVRVIDLPAERVRAGTCPDCSQPLYVTAGNETVKCRPCDVSWDVAHLRGEMLAKVMDYSDTAQNIVRVLNASYVPLKLKRLTSWADRRQVTFTETDIGRVFVVRDVLAVIEKVERGEKLAV